MEYLFVYGTLKTSHAFGYEHSPVLSKDARNVYLGRARTVKKYAMSGLRVYEELEELNVLGEAYQITEKSFIPLDEYEGNGFSYNRKKIPVLLESGEAIEAWIYFMPLRVHPIELGKKTIGTRNRIEKSFDGVDCYIW